ncbi:chemotaxis protein CheX [Anaerocolumna xylanovorans]|uniref:Chemotaxis protein CheX n=1 Tax=Anaerocolumna xylanovorans DSM 12503 TaxID=1121345 RepID=A0A1M7YH49_9FIRM|nr:chemotaxis protein CheX [Anaerocolumna xylanovorans]SHO51955.1 chemotaxis protein CheX [Anaerocolumna xylanovorans DSM 12503]
MDVKHINPFINAFATVIPQLGFSTVKKGALSVKGKELLSSGVIIVLGIVGAIKGNVVYTMDMENAKKIASSMMMGMPVNELDEMAQSALAELTNMLTANAATCFADLGISIDISTPTLLHGKNISLKMSSSQVLCVQLLADDIPIEINIAIES